MEDSAEKKKCIINCDTTVQSGQAAPSNSKDFQGTWVVVKSSLRNFSCLIVAYLVKTHRMGNFKATCCCY